MKGEQKGNRRKYDDEDAEKKRVYYINVIKPNQSKAKNPKGRPKNNSEVVYLTSEEFERARMSAITRLKQGACLQIRTMMRYKLMDVTEYVDLNEINHLSCQEKKDAKARKMLKDVKARKLLEPPTVRANMIIKSLLFHIMEKDMMKIIPKLLSGLKKVQRWGTVMRCTILVFATKMAEE